ncbi:MAG: hypothetical protein QOG00_265 [Pyrinomonadaceae bacterium]|nr:hypothetical protein [Pyrinomonadaceae bacterium]
MFVEDLSGFFDLAGHAVEAVIKNVAGEEVRTIPVIFETPLQAMTVFDSDVELEQPTALCRTSHLTGVRHKFTLTIGAEVYTIVGMPNDGTGVTTLQLKA